MPYINQEKRNEIYDGNPPKTAGELNYLFSQEIVNYLYINGESYQTYNDIIGVLEATKLELYRRLVARYEDKKLGENGDVYEL